MAGVLFRETARSKRIERSPQHSFNVRHRPYQLTPIMIAPVLPGESLTNYLGASRVVTDPIKDPLVGWWIEYWFFYVKHTDLGISEDLMELHLNIDKSLAEHYSAADVAYFHPGGTVNYLKLCTERVVAEYFRDEDDPSPLTRLIDGYHAVRVKGDTWTQSLQPVPAPTEQVNLTVGVDDKFSMEELSNAQRTWQFMKDHELTDKTYEDYLRSNGVNIPEAEKPQRPELINYDYQWTYPTNHVDPATGVPASAVSWSSKFRADKKRFFKEPGFIVGYTCARPKVYFSGQTGPGVGLLVDTLSWLPAVMRPEPETSLKIVAGGTGPVNVPGDHVVDVRDLFVHGDQFRNYAAAGSTLPVATLPDTDLNVRYPDLADAKAPFKATTAEYIRQDGVCNLNILGHQADHTP